MRPVQCYRCGYHWEYSGSSTEMAKCPRCKSSVIFRISEKRAQEGRITVLEPKVVGEEIPISCPRCGHCWVYKGMNQFQTRCHNCDTTVTFARVRELIEEAVPRYTPDHLIGRPLKKELS